jgi:hypothetical protein
MPMTLKSVLVAAFVGPVLTGCVVTRTPMLPPEVHDPGAFPDGLAEPPLWPSAAMAGYRRRLRLVLSPMVRQRVSIRIDTDATGRTVAHFTRLEPSGEGRVWEITETRGRPVSAAAVARLDALISQSKLWGIYPQYWQYPAGEICVDGVEMIMERASTQGYRFSEGNAQCTMPSSVLAVAAQMIDIADPGDRQVASWLH